MKPSLDRSSQLAMYCACCEMEGCPYNGHVQRSLMYHHIDSFVVSVLIITQDV